MGEGDGRAAPHPAEGGRFRDLGFQQPIVLAPTCPALGVIFCLP